jgi:hypothetical protein
MQTRDGLTLAVLTHMRTAERNLAKGFCDRKNIEILIVLERVLKLVVEFEKTLLIDDID